jgi:hypothetical protein
MEKARRVVFGSKNAHRKTDVLTGRDEHAVGALVVPDAGGDGSGIEDKSYRVYTNDCALIAAMGPLD